MKKILSTLKYFIFITLGLIMVWWSLKDVDKSFVLSIVLGSKLIYLIPVTIILLASHFVRACRWNLLINSLGYKPNIINSFFCIMIGYIANLLVPRLGEVLRCTTLSKYEKIPTDKIVGTVILERAIDLIFLLVVTFITLAIQVDVIGDFFMNDFILKLKNISLKKYIYFLLILIGVIAIMTILIKKFPFLHKSFLYIKTFLLGVLDGIKVIFYLKQKIQFLGLSCLIWIGYVSAIWFSFIAITETSHLGIKASLSALVMGSIGMIVTQGGVGSYPLLIEKTLALYDIAKNFAVASGWLNWTVQFLITLFFGATCWLLIPFYNTCKNRKK